MKINRTHDPIEFAILDFMGVYLGGHPDNPAVPAKKLYKKLQIQAHLGNILTPVSFKFALDNLEEMNWCKVYVLDGKEMVESGAHVAWEKLLNK